MLLTSTFREKLRVKRNLLVAAAGFLVSCQLVALALIAGDQVQKASARQAQQTVQRAAVAKCLDINTAAQRSWCLSQAHTQRPADGVGALLAHQETDLPNARSDGVGAVVGGAVVNFQR